METFSLDPFETLIARVVSSGETKVMGGLGVGVWVMETTE